MTKTFERFIVGRLILTEEECDILKNAEEILLQICNELPAGAALTDNGTGEMYERTEIWDAYMALNYLKINGSFNVDDNGERFAPPLGFTFSFPE